jgi:hypothetical protein
MSFPACEAFTMGEFNCSLNSFGIHHCPAATGNCALAAVHFKLTPSDQGTMNSVQAFALDQKILQLRRNAAALIQFAYKGGDPVFRRLVAEDECELKVKANNDHAFIIERGLDIDSYLTKLGMDGTYSTSVMFMSLAQLAGRPIVVLAVMSIQDVGTRNLALQVNVYNPKACCGPWSATTAKPIWLILALQEGHCYLAKERDGGERPLSVHLDVNPSAFLREVCLCVCVYLFSIFTPQ